MKIGFWNIGKNDDLNDVVIDFIVHYDLDIIILAEPPEGFFLKLKKHPRFKKFKQVTDGDECVEIFTWFNKNHVNKVIKERRNSAYKIKTSNGSILNMVACHFPSKKNWSNEGQAMECANLSNTINEVEKKTRSEKTVLIGDLNMNPFENGVMAANGLNAIQDKEYVIKNRNRVVNERRYGFFYNPMWQFFGDYNHPFGTYYKRVAEPVSVEWNIFDQVLLKPDLLSYFAKDSVKIISKIGMYNIFNFQNRPYKSYYSDHFPIFLNLNI
jgi:hypothetical protein